MTLSEAINSEAVDRLSYGGSYQESKEALLSFFQCQDRSINDVLMVGQLLFKHPVRLSRALAELESDGLIFINDEQLICACDSI